MFSLTGSIPSEFLFDPESSEFHRTYPLESFDSGDPDNSPVESVLYYACGVMTETGLFEFTIDAGNQTIPMPVRPELSILLNQIEGVFSLLRAEVDTADVQFFEQGCEMQIKFVRDGDLIGIACSQGRSNQFEHHQISASELRERLVRFLLQFVTAVSRLTPGLIREPAFERWMSRIMLGTH